jgi:hypothetical protein
MKLAFLLPFSAPETQKSCYSIEDESQTESDGSQPLETKGYHRLLDKRSHSAEDESEPIEDDGSQYFKAQSQSLEDESYSLLGKTTTFSCAFPSYVFICCFP